MDQTDKEHILRTNQYYIAQVSSMEIKISELKAQLHAKDFEIDYLASKLSPSKSVYDKNFGNHELELQLSIALQENEVLKKKIVGIEEIGTLKSQLEHALRMKDVFEQKYRELNLQGIINVKHTALESEKDEIINKLKQELENEKKLREECEKNYESVLKENESLKMEAIERSKNMQDMKKQVFRNSQRESEKKNMTEYSVGSGNLFFRPQSASQSRKYSPDTKVVRETNIRKNLVYQSPKLNCTTEIPKRPKVVSISLESSLIKH
jgi:hypothetical protein